MFDSSVHELTCWVKEKTKCCQDICKDIDSIFSKLLTTNIIFSPSFPPIPDFDADLRRKSAIIIQRSWRLFLLRRKKRVQKARHAFAVIIHGQKIMRGYSSSFSILSFENLSDLKYKTRDLFPIKGTFEAAMYYRNIRLKRKALCLWMLRFSRDILEVE
ncbi:hypothetical protein ADUPG1_010418 [Aduncisulcus paluster]|uniref:Maturase K n=1 Tax=Aduncisulcus paluster TaxID=2918883 RepID=A0ABQ5JRN3_9EUKA|nr:hypothetical protein ADUPG1_010418 [Aduncisulcus paluster]|eukprot:gnl/Carplike_NY0171/26459_a50076_59.p1 GENE.gnl/Carplike_NY0171/26459_a50076_59~~gnl/Carplike_NY0171/26459_a50076_59.p1  ORF type:complete len:159 (+),score=13.05 gnl/Carplike_NY0171/26459_a50076_59:49-525(+)